LRSSLIRKTGLAAALSLISALVLALVADQALQTIPDPLKDDRADFEPSVRIEDRRGRLLREFLSPRDVRTEWVPLEKMSPFLIEAALAAEDRRFYSHGGVDVSAVLRALGQNIIHRRIVSGASTITMQLARLLIPGPRTWPQKIRETVLALRLEQLHSKDRILAEYLNRAPCGNQIYGLPAAARLYLDKTPANLTPAEAAFLLALPQAPSALNPYRRVGPALARRNRILARMAALGFLTDSQKNRAQAEPLNLSELRRPFLAPHFVTQVKSRLSEPGPGVVRTTLDLEIQSQVERLVEQAVSQGRDKGLTQAAALVLDHHSGEILAWVGSADFFDEKEGQNDGVTALRQPGSAVKPLTYAAAFDAGLTPADLVEDAPVDFGLRRGVYRPVNYDRRFRGPVSLRTALASSLNVPAVKVLERVGLTRVLEKMKAAGLKSLTKEPDFYGLGLTLGGGEVSLLELAEAYATLAAGGVYRPSLMLRPENPDSRPAQRVFSPQAAYLVTDILADDAARAAGFGRDSVLALPFPAAAKTGTSKNFRDNWAVGYTTSVVVAVWAGNFDGRPMGSVSGVSGAGPLWRRIMRLLARYYPPESFTRPEGLIEATVCPETGLRAATQCPRRRDELFMTGRLPPGYCLRHQTSAPAKPPQPEPGRLAILTPRSGEQYLFDPGIETGFQNLGLEAQAASGIDWLVWSVDGREIGRIRTDRQPLPRIFWPLRPGPVKITLAGQAQGRTVAADQVVITVH